MRRFRTSGVLGFFQEEHTQNLTVYALVKNLSIIEVSRTPSRHRKRPPSTPASSPAILVLSPSSLDCGEGDDETEEGEGEGEDGLEEGGSSKFLTTRGSMAAESWS